MRHSHGVMSHDGLGDQVVERFSRTKQLYNPNAELKSQLYVLTLQIELDAIPHVLIAVRDADQLPPRELPAELSSAVEVTEDQVRPSLRRTLRCQTDVAGVSGGRAGEHCVMRPRQQRRPSLARSPADGHWIVRRSCHHMGQVGMCCRLGGCCRGRRARGPPGWGARRRPPKATCWCC